MNVQGDEPLIAPSSIDAVVKLLLDRPEDVMSTVRRRIDDPADLSNPSVVKVVTDARGYALYFTRSAVPYVRPDQPAPIFWRHLGLYALPALISFEARSAYLRARSNAPKAWNNCAPSSTGTESAPPKPLPIP